jgi:hypothetical protein
MESQTQSSILYPTLSTINSHSRDKNIEFYEPTHKYTILTDPNSTYTSVTTWNHSHFPHFDSNKIIEQMMKGKNWNPKHKYWGMTAEEIKKKWSDNGASVSSAGTDMHFQIECFMNNYVEKEKLHNYNHQDLLNQYTHCTYEQPENIKNTTLEWKYFLEFVKDHPTFRPYRTEWTIYDEELKLAGSIDMVYENPDGSLMIYDWKRCKDISTINTFNKYAITQCISQYPDSNFWHYALQLNTYKAILESKYGKKVTNLCLVRLHPDSEEKTYELIPLPDLSNDIKSLFELRKKEIEEQDNKQQQIENLHHVYKVCL